MNENQIEKFIHLIQQNNYTIESMQYATKSFKKILIIKSKCLLKPKILISFTDVAYSNVEDLLEEAEVLNEKFNSNKSLIVLLIVPSNTNMKNNLWFNGNLMVHLVAHDEMINCLYFEKSFHYLGGRRVRNLIYLLNQSL